MALIFEMRDVATLLVAVSFVYANSLTAPFVFDAEALVLDDARIHEASAENLHQIVTQNYWGKRFASGLYRPITSTSYLMNYAITGERPFGYHLINVAIHAASVLVLYGLLLQLGFAGAFWAALLWAVHPINTEVVTNIAGRPDLLATFAVIFGLWVYIGPKLPTRLVFLFCLAAFGMFSKETAAVLLPLSLFCDIWRRRRPDWLACSVIALPVGLYFAVRSALHLTMARPFVDNPLFHARFLESRLIALKTLAMMTAKWFLPLTLSPDYSFSQIPARCSIPQALLGIGGASILLGWAVSRRRKPEFLLLGFLAITILPTSNLIFPIGSIAAERFYYLPGIALAGIVAVVFMKLPPRPRLALFVLLTLALGARTIRRNYDYGDTLRFWQAAAEASPGSFKTHSQLSTEYFERGCVDKAVEEAEKALTILGPVPAKDDVMLTWAQAFRCYEAKHDTLGMKRAADRTAAILNAQGDAR